MHDTGKDDHTKSFWWRSPASTLALCVVAAIALYLVTAHTGHVIGYLPYLLLAACPLMHLFMHHGHGRHQHRGSDSATRPQESKR